MNQHLNSTSISLLDRLRRNDEDAWSRLVQIYGPVVYGWSRKRGLSPEDASDIMQEVFRAVMRSIGSFQRPSNQSGAFRGWLWTITRHKNLDFVRNIASQPIARGGSTALQKLHALASTDVDSDDPSMTSDVQPADGEELSGIHRRAIDLVRHHFDRTTWQAFWRTAVDGCSPEDVANELGVSRWAVYKARSRILERLRSDLEGLV